MGGGKLQDTDQAGNIWSGDRGAGGKTENQQPGEEVISEREGGTIL